MTGSRQTIPIGWGARGEGDEGTEAEERSRRGREEEGVGNKAHKSSQEKVVGEHEEECVLAAADRALAGWADLGDSVLRVRRQLSPPSCKRRPLNDDEKHKDDEIRHEEPKADQVEAGLGSGLSFVVVDDVDVLDEESVDDDLADVVEDQAAGKRERFSSMLLGERHGPAPVCGRAG